MASATSNGVSTHASRTWGATSVSLDDQGWAQRRDHAEGVTEPEPWVGWANGGTQDEATTEPDALSSGRPAAPTANGYRPAQSWHRPASPSSPASAPPPAPPASTPAAPRTPAGPPRPADREPALFEPASHTPLDGDTRRALFSELRDVGFGEPEAPAPSPPPADDRGAMWTEQAHGSTESAPPTSTKPDVPAAPEPARRPDRDDTDVSALLRELHELSLDD